MAKVNQAMMSAVRKKLLTGVLVGLALVACSGTKAVPSVAPSGTSLRDCSSEKNETREESGPTSSDQQVMWAKIKKCWSKELDEAGAHIDRPQVPRDLARRFRAYLWTSGHITANCGAVSFSSNGGGIAHGFFVASRWEYEGREYRRVQALSLKDGQLEALTSSDIQMLNEDLFWETVSRDAVGDGGFRVLGIYNRRENGTFFFEGVPARMRLRCRQEECSAECDPKPYFAQLRSAPRSDETPPRNEVPGISPYSWAAKCAHRRDLEVEALFNAGEHAELWVARRDVRPPTIYTSREKCLADARPADPAQIVVRDFPRFAKIEVRRVQGNPTGVTAESELRILSKNQVDALVALFAEKDAFTGAKPSPSGAFDELMFVLLDNSRQRVETGAVNVPIDCSSGAQDYVSQEFSSLGKARCEKLMELLGEYPVLPVENPLRRP